MKKSKIINVLIRVYLSAAILLLQPHSIFSQSLQEYEVKAAFLYQFTKFIEWPATRASDSLTVCIFGNDPFGETLDELEAENGTAARIQIRRIEKLSDIDACHLLFISHTNQDKAFEIVREAEGKNVVTVSEIGGFIQRGGMINFVRQGNKIRFEINQKQAQKEGINISSKLLSLALKVITP